MNTSPWLKKISISGLHGSINLTTEFNSGINVIYGQNGVGKTTLLHVISNIANMDFERFNELVFETISLTFSDEFNILLRNRKGASPHLFLNNQYVRTNDNKIALNDVEKKYFERYFGKNPVYVPAFRNILQKIDENSLREKRYAYEYDTLAKKLHLSKHTSSLHESQKTLQCRSWFGYFVPEIRYPSVEEVEEGLETYWTRADSAAKREEAKLISEATNQILANLLGTNPHKVKEAIEDVLNEIPSSMSVAKEIPESFIRAISIAKQNSTIHKSTPEALAELYVEAIINARIKSDGIFKRINKFIESMDGFLAPDRRFKVGSKYSSRAAARIHFFKEEDKSYSVSALSSGERQLLTLLYTAWRAPHDSRIMLIDEPEISLHIDWQRKILPEMHKQGDQQIISCTHSPEVAADLDDGYQVFDRFSEFRA